MSGYLIPAKQADAEIEIKKSRFLAFAKGVVSREAGMQWLKDLKTAYPDARHHCWAYQLGDPRCAVNAGMGDDGEPSGTAGKPILNVLQHKDVGDIMIVVVRYFGGIKLGAGGLTRAYSQAAQTVMDVLETTPKIVRVSLSLQCEFSQEQSLRHLLDLYKGALLEVTYSHKVSMDVSLPNANETEFCEQLAALGAALSKQE